MTEFRQTHWLAELDDINRLRRFAFRHRLGDSAITIKRLLDIAEDAEAKGLLGDHAHPIVDPKELREWDRISTLPKREP